MKRFFLIISFLVSFIAYADRRKTSFPPIKDDSSHTAPYDKVTVDHHLILEDPDMKDRSADDLLDEFCALDDQPGSDEMRARIALALGDKLLLQNIADCRFYYGIALRSGNPRQRVMAGRRFISVITKFG